MRRPLRAPLLLSLLRAVLSALPPLETFEFASDTATLADHRAFGSQFGKRFAAGIQKRFGAKDSLKALLAVANTTAGAALYEEFLTLHEATYPQYIAELHGLADGSGIPFRTFFIQNIFQEFGACAAAKGLPGAPARGAVDACSDQMVCDVTSGGLCAVGHNEDNDVEDRDAIAIAHVRLGPAGGASSSFVAATYLGELPTGAFGFNAIGGFGFTLNWMGPTDVACAGLGRGFVSRSLLDAPSFDAAKSRATSARMAAGHNYQLFRIDDPVEVLNIEVAPRGLYAVRPIGRTPFFHANQYQTLSVPNIVSNSSERRIERAAQLPPPRSIDDIKRTLGDQADVKWPIFHDAASHAKGEAEPKSWTACTAIFDLKAKTLTIYRSNPANGIVATGLDLQ